MAGNVSFTGLDVATTEGTANTAIISGDNTLMMIPQSFDNNNQKITLDYTDAYGINLQLSVSLSGTSWTAGQCVTYNVGGVHGITKVSDQTRNPLWYVARYNMNQNGTFDKSHNNASQGDWRFSWDTATAAFAGGSTSRNGYYTQGLAISNVDSDESSYRFHLPTVQEWYSIMPILSSTNSPNYNIVIGISSNAIGEGLQTEKASVFHHANAHTATSYQSYWGEESSTTRYAIRFLGTNYCSVWQYRMLGTFESSASSVGRLEIKSEVIDAISASNTNKLKAVIDALKNNKYVWSSNAVTRTFYTCGYHGSAAGAVNYDQGVRGLYMSATIDPANTIGSSQTCFYMNFDAATAFIVSHMKHHGLSVRLFKD